MIFEGNNWLSKKIVRFIAEHTPRCHDITRLLSEGMDRQLPWSVRVKIRLHYTVCVWCERYGQQLRVLRGAVQKLPDRLPQDEHAKMPDDRKERLRKRLREKS